MPSSTRVIKTAALSIASTGRLDLSDNKLIVIGARVNPMRPTRVRSKNANAQAFSVTR